MPFLFYFSEYEYEYGYYYVPNLLFIFDKTEYKLRSNLDIKHVSLIMTIVLIEKWYQYLITIFTIEKYFSICCEILNQLYS